METWQERLRKRSIASLEALAQRFGAEHLPEIDRLKQAVENFEFRIAPAMVDLIESPEDPIWRQYVPTVQELEVHDGLVDSLAEDANSPVPNITHRYPDRALFLVSPVCASYCRFCTRRRKVGDPEKIPMREFESAFRYLEQHTEIRDVIMSGRHPLLLSGRRRRALPHDRREGARDHQGAARLDVGARGAPLRHRRAGRWRQDPAPSRVRGVDHGRRSRAEELRGGAIRVPSTRARADPRRLSWTVAAAPQKRATIASAVAFPPWGAAKTPLPERRGPDTFQASRLRGVPHAVASRRSCHRPPTVPHRSGRARRRPAIALGLRAGHRAGRPR